MAESLFRVPLGFSIDDKFSILQGEVDPSAGSGVAAPAGSLYAQNAAGVDGGAIWKKEGDADTDWKLLGDNDELGYIRDYIGKTGPGVELPQYSSENVVANDDALVTAIGKIDAEIGAAVVPLIRTNSPILDQAINLNIQALDAAIGADADLVNTNYIAAAGSIYDNLSALDGQVKTNTDAISALQEGYRMIEKVKVVTGDDISAKSGTAVTFSDDDTGGAITLQVGDRIASTNAASNDDIYIVQSGAWTTVALAEKDAFYTSFNLPDPQHQERLALYYYDGSTIVQIADFDFETADSIALTGGYASAAGTVAGGDTVQKAISNLDQGQQDLVSLSGVAANATDLGAFTGGTIPDDQTIKSALQYLETAVEDNDSEIQNLEDAVGSDTGLAGITYTEQNYVTDGESLLTGVDKLDIGLNKARHEESATGVTTATAVDSMLVDDYDVAKWLVVCVDAGDPTVKEAFEVFAVHDGSVAADATSVDYTTYAKLKTGTISGLSLDVVLSGTGAAQVMSLQITSTSSVDVKSVRQVV